MKQLLLYLILILFVLTVTTCRKKTWIKVKVYNYALNEPIANATVVLFEKKGESGGGIFGGNASCKEIGLMTTDSNGECHFEKEKLRAAGKYNYFLAITNAYGIQQNYPCGGKTSGFLDKSKTQAVALNASYFDGYFRIQYNNLFNPSQIGDSLIVMPRRLIFNTPEGGTVGGGGIFGGGIYVSSGNNNYPPTFNSQPDKVTGIIVIDVRKRKLGVLSTYSDTIKAYPNKTTTAQINW